LNGLERREGTISKRMMMGVSDYAVEMNLRVTVVFSVV
jgi:hypothetical protein